MPADAKVVGPRLLHGTQWGIECPIHTPDGGNIGLHKHLALLSHITDGEPSEKTPATTAISAQQRRTEKRQRVEWIGIGLDGLMQRPK